MEKLTIRNPYNGATLGELPLSSEAETRATLERATKAFASWRHSPAWERAQLLARVADAVEQGREEIARLIRDEAGKPITYARVEVDRGVGVLRWASAEAQRFAGELLRLDASATGRPGFGIATKFPRGPVLGITPFNFPFNLALHKVAPAVASGCPIVVKPSPYTPLTALKIAELFAAAGAPQGLVQVLVAGDATTETLTRAPEIAFISFTGSARVGKLIRAQAPQKQCTLELGGNAWMIVMEDTPRELLPAIASKIASAAFGYAGQSCISVQNVAIAESLWTDARAALAEATRATGYGDPSSDTVVSGPVINAASAKRIGAELERAKGEITRSDRAQGAASPLVLPPTLVTLDQPAASGALDVPLVQEEIFGPVMTAARFDELPQLIARINSSKYGLQAGVYTQNWPTIQKLYAELDVGGLVVNDVPTTRFDHQPYGGVKDSGEGREGVRYAMEEMTVTKFLALSSTVAGAPASKS